MPTARGWWAKNFPELYGSAEEEEPEDPRYPRKKKELTGHELRHLITSLAEDKIGADYDVVRARHRQDLVFHLQHLEEKRRAAEAAMKQK